VDAIQYQVPLGRKIDDARRFPRWVVQVTIGHLCLVAVLVLAAAACYAKRWSTLLLLRSCSGLGMNRRSA